MTVWNILLWTLGILLALVLICLVSIWWRRSGRPAESYDERQKIAHGEAFQVSLVVGSGYYLVLAILYTVQMDRDSYSVEPSLGIFFGFMLQAMIYHIYCLLTRSALPLNQKPLTTAICYALPGLMQLWNGYSWYAKRGVPISLTGEGTILCLYLMAGVCFLSLSVMHLIAMACKERE